MIELVLVSLLSVAGAPSAEPAGDVKRSSARKICRSAVKTATRIDAHRVCRTRGEWASIEFSPAARAKTAQRGAGDDTHELDGVFGVMTTAPALKDQIIPNKQGGPNN